MWPFGCAVFDLWQRTLVQDPLGGRREAPRSRTGSAATEFTLWAEFAAVAVATLVTHPSIVALALFFSPDGVFHCWREGALVVQGYSWEEEAGVTRQRLLTYLVTFLGCAQLLRVTLECVAGLLSEPLQAVSQAGAEALDRLRQEPTGANCVWFGVNRQAPHTQCFLFGSGVQNDVGISQLDFQSSDSFFLKL